jgi:hypothetical protein
VVVVPFGVAGNLDRFFFAKVQKPVDAFNTARFGAVIDVGNRLSAQTTILRKMRNHRPNRFGGLVALPLALVSAAGLLLGLAGPSSAIAATDHGSSGTFTFGGYISGTLKVPAFLPSSNHTDCSITASNLRTDVPNTEVFNWSKVKLNVGGRSKRIAFIDLQIQVTKFGRTNVLTHQNEAPNSIYFSTGALYNWLSNSGSVTTVRSGASGSVDGTLSAGTNHPGTVTIKGHWAGCTILHN